MLKSFVWSFGTSAAVLILGVVTGIVAARVLGPEDRGNLGIVVFWGQFLAVFATMSLADAIVLRAGRQLPGNELLSRAFQLSIVAICTALPIGVIVIGAAVGARSALVVTAALAFWAVQVVFACIDQVAQGRLRAEHRFHLLNALRLSIPFGYLAFMIVAVLFDAGLIGFVAAHIAALALALAFRLWIAAPCRKAEGASPELGGLLRTSVSFHRAAVVGLLVAQLDRLIVVQTETTERIGLYLVATTLAGPVQGFLASAIKSIALPALVRADASGRPIAALRLLRMTWLASVVGAAVTAAVAPVLTTLLFGVAFAEAGPLTVALTAAIALAPTRAALGEAFKADGNGRQPLVGEIIFGASFVVSFAAAAAAQLPWAVIWGVAAANLVAALYLACAYRKNHPMVTISSWAVPNHNTYSEALAIIRAMRN